MSRSLHSYINTFPTHSKCFAGCGVFFNVKCQNGLNNCKANASRSPLGCLDMSTGYTDVICVTHLSVVVLSVVFTSVEVSGEDCMVCSEKALIPWGPGLPAGVHSLDVRNKRDPASKSLDSQVGSFSFCLSWHVFCWPTQPSSLSFQVVATVAGFSHFTVSCFLKNLQEQFLELGQQVPRWAAADRRARPAAVCPRMSWAAAVEPQQSSGFVVCPKKVFATTLNHHR